ncbi:putative acetyltransferase [Chondrocystis sp. NIES-4102]|nr:putative acetyltransferase [Chondrocystis sp. NIES-4102]
MVEVIRINDINKIVTALEANLFSYWSNYGRSNLAQLYTASNLVYFVTGINSVLYNQVVYAQLTVDQVESAIAQVFEHFIPKRIPFCWWTSPSTQPTDLGLYLEAKGLMYLGEFPGMAIDLSNLDSQQQLKDIKIIRVNDLNTLKSWLEIAAVGFNVPLTLLDEILPLEASLAMESPGYIRYLALWQNTPVAISALYLNAGVAGIYFVTTLPAARGKGIATNITQTALKDAQKLGYKVAILQASVMGKNIYQRLGFQECCQLGMYAWLPANY